jgi:SSS family solute:Na+ symporter
MAFEIDYTVCIIAMAVLTGVYVIVGGYMATAINDFIQGMIMLVGIVAVIIASHHENIKRLKNGTERKFGSKKESQS